MGYKKRYPKGHHAATPYLKDSDGPCYVVDGQELARRMGRAYHRRDRWQYHVARRRPRVPRPPTAAERTLARLRYYADELAALLVPFRQTRPLGHEPLRGLLQDADTRPALVTQVTHLRSCVAWLRPLYLTHQAEVNAWRAEWAHASAERRQCILHVHRAQAIQDQLTGLVLLSEEAQADAARIEHFSPDAFAATAGQWWYTAPLSYWPAPAAPTPYSA